MCNNYYGMPDITQYVFHLNNTAITLLDGLINLKERLLITESFDSWYLK